MSFGHIFAAVATSAVVGFCAYKAGQINGENKGANNCFDMVNKSYCDMVEEAHRKEDEARLARSNYESIQNYGDSKDAAKKTAEDLEAEVDKYIKVDEVLGPIVEALADYWDTH